MFGIGIWQLLIILAIIVLIFGTKKLKNMGQDLGGALKGFKNAVGEKDEEEDEPEAHDIDFSEVSEEKISESKEEVVKPKRARSTAKKAARPSAKKKATTAEKKTAKATSKK